MAKAAYKRRHLIGDLRTVSEAESMAVVVRECKRQVSRQAWHWSNS